MSSPLSSIVTIDYSTEDDTAIAGENYEQTSGSLIIAAGSISASIIINIIGDLSFEEDELFS